MKPKRLKVTSHMPLTTLGAYCSRRDSKLSNTSSQISSLNKRYSKIAKLKRLLKAGLASARANLQKRRAKALKIARGQVSTISRLEVLSTRAFRQLIVLMPKTTKSGRKSTSETKQSSRGQSAAAKCSIIETIGQMTSPRSRYSCLREPSPILALTRLMKHLRYRNSTFRIPFSETLLISRRLKEH